MNGPLDRVVLGSNRNQRIADIYLVYARENHQPRRRAGDALQLRIHCLVDIAVAAFGTLRRQRPRGRVVSRNLGQALMGPALVAVVEVEREAA